MDGELLVSAVTEVAQTAAEAAEVATPGGLAVVLKEMTPVHVLGAVAIAGIAGAVLWKAMDSKTTVTWSDYGANGSFGPGGGPKSV